MTKRWALVAVAMLATTLAPTVGRADQVAHCKATNSLYLGSPLLPKAAGQATGYEDLWEDLGGVGCNQQVVDANTNYIAPQSDTVVIAARSWGGSCNAFFKPVGVQIKFGNGPWLTKAVSCTYDTQPFESTPIDVPAGTTTITVHATMYTSRDITQDPELVTTTYKTTKPF